MRPEGGDREMAVTLYYGDNGTQEFWESVKREIVILKNHKEGGWSAHHNEIVLTDTVRQAKADRGTHCILSGELDYVIKALKQQHDIKVILDRSKQWVNGPDSARMILKRVIKIDRDKKTRIIPLEAIMECSKKSTKLEHWFPKHDCGDPKCPMRGK